MPVTGQNSGPLFTHDLDVESWVVGAQGSSHPDSDYPEIIDPPEPRGEPLKLNGQNLSKAFFG